MKDQNKQIITSLLDVDFYKFTMMYFVFIMYNNIKVKYEFKNRNAKIKLANIIHVEELKKQLDYVKDIKFKENEIKYLYNLKKNGKSLFDNDSFFEHLKNFTIPDYKLNVVDNDFELHFSGDWKTAILWETLALSIVNELYYKHLTEEKDSDYYREGLSRLEQKIDELKKYPEISIIEFGTRRRFSKNWQEVVLRSLKEDIPNQLLGTSNTKLAMTYSLEPIGTMAHELFMVCAGMFQNDDSIFGSHNQVIRDWWYLFGSDLSIALTDTFGSSFFFKDMTQKQAEKWKGLRHDSGDPFDFCRKAIRFYENYGINPKTKMIVFSDGLDVSTIIELYLSFKDEVKMCFGWGTNLTNDLGFGPLSIVVKAAEVNGNRTVKLSDNLSKAMGDKIMIDRYKKIFGHCHNNFSETIY